MGSKIIEIFGSFQARFEIMRFLGHFSQPLPSTLLPQTCYEASYVEKSRMN